MKYIFECLLEQVKALLMYDLSDVSSVDGVDHWREQVRSLTGPSSVFVVVGCKSDLRTAPGV